MDMKKTIKIAMTLFLAMPSLLAAEEQQPERYRNSFAILGGAGLYEYRIHPDPASVILYQLLTSSLNVSSTSPLRLMADMEQYSPTEIKGTSSLGRLQYEHLFLDSQSLGLTAGLSSASYTEKCEANCGTYTSLLLMQSLVNPSSPMGSMLALMLMPSPNSSSAKFSLTTLDIGLNYHIAPESFVDPYLGVGAGLGVCSIPGSSPGVICTGVKYGGRLGTKINFNNRFFMMVQTEIDRVELAIVTEDGGGKAVMPAPDKHILAGIGFSF